MNELLGNVNEFGQAILTWCLVIGTVWGIFKGTQVGQKVKDSKAAEQGEKWLAIIERVAEAAVRATEQQWKATEKGPGSSDAKLREALTRARELLPPEVPAHITGASLVSAVEAAVGRMNEGKAK
jgi:hypothetical protein